VFLNYCIFHIWYVSLSSCYLYVFIDHFTASSQINSRQYHNTSNRHHIAVRRNWIITCLKLTSSSFFFHVCPVSCLIFHNVTMFRSTPFLIPLFVVLGSQGLSIKFVVLVRTTQLSCQPSYLHALLYFTQSFHIQSIFLHSSSYHCSAPILCHVILLILSIIVLLLAYAPSLS